MTTTLNTPCLRQGKPQLSLRLATVDINNQYTEQRGNLLPCPGGGSLQNLARQSRWNWRAAANIIVEVKSPMDRLGNYADGRR